MIKLLFYGLIIFLLYRYVFNPPRLQRPSSRPNIKKKTNKEDDDGEYIDYEEVK